MKWEKLGLVYCPKPGLAWRNSHATNPIIESLGDDLFTVYFSTRDAQNRSSIGTLRIEFKDQFKILEEAEQPILSPGDPGLFDDSGVSMGCITQVGVRKFLYYMGWNLGVTVPWRNSIGLAIYDDKLKKFTKYSRVPLLDRAEVDPFSLSYPFVLREGDLYRMWYGSNLSWGKNAEEMQHVIKYAESSDGIHWAREGRVAIALSGTNEIGVSRPFVLKEEGIYKMWFSYRGDHYRIGFATSKDGKNWKREDSRAGLIISPSGWDSQAVEYPFIFEHRGARYCLYNGNGYGKTGIGLARLLE